MKRILFLNKNLQNDINIVEQHIDHQYYANYFLFPFLISEKIAAIHYCLIGWKKAYNPTKNFSTYFYLEKHLDVKKERINPFSHYHTFGYREKRVIKFETEADYFEIAPKFIFSCSHISKILLRIFLTKDQAKPFSLYFDVKEYRQHIRWWKFAYFPSILRLHYLIKGRKVNVRPSQIYDPLNSPFKGTFLELLENLPQRKFTGIHVTDYYKEWIEKNEITPKSEYQTKIKNFKYNPLISVIIPVFNANLTYLKKAIQSVRNQFYNNWEICIADDKSTDPELIAYLQKLSKEDKIKITFRNKNGHISACSNSALELAKGEFIALLDQDDLLSNNALFEIVFLLNKNKNYKLIFSNEDKVDAIGKRFDPYFKKGWNYHLLLSQNYISHLGVYKYSIIKKIGGFQLGYEGSQDYDLLLRFIEQIKEEEIGFINKFLYHWRAIKGSTALNVDEKSYAINAGKKALQDHLDRTKQQAKALSSIFPQYYRVKRELTSTPLVSILIPTRNHLNDLKLAVNSILYKNSYQNIELLIINNDSDEQETLDYFNEISSISKVSVIHYPGEFNYSAINNFAAQQSKGELLLLLNNDVEAINDHWLEEMVSQILPKDVAIVGSKLLYPDDTIQHAGVEIGLGGVAGHIFNGLYKDALGDFGRLQLIQNYDAVTAACLLVKKKYFDKVGGLDEINLKVAFNDVDLCLKIRSIGKKIVYTPYSELYHYESKSRGSDVTVKNRERFNREIDFMKQKWAMRPSPN